MTEWPTVSNRHVPHLGRQFSVTIIRVKAKCLVVGAGLGIVAHMAYPQRCFFSLQAYLIQTPSECPNKPRPGKLLSTAYCAEQVCARCGDFLDLFQMCFFPCSCDECTSPFLMNFGGLNLSNDSSWGDLLMTPQTETAPMDYGPGGSGWFVSFPQSVL